MIRPGHLTGIVVWRIAPCGTTSVMLDRVYPNGQAAVSSKGQNGWAKRPMTVYCADLFDTRLEAQTEYRRRRAIAIAADPRAYLNFVSGFAEQWEEGAP